MDTQKIVFMNKELNLRLAGLLFLPDAFDLSKDYPAVVVTGPMLSVKEQAQSVYAKKLTEAGYVTLVFDGAYFGESEGLPRCQELPDVKAVNGSNYIDVNGVYDPETGLIKLFSAQDNLGKGAALQAIQAFNAMFSLPETTGLSTVIRGV